MNMVETDDAGVIVMLHDVRAEWRHSSNSSYTAPPLPLQRPVFVEYGFFNVSWSVIFNDKHNTTDLIYFGSLFNTALCFGCLHQSSSGRFRFIKGIKRDRPLLTNSGAFARRVRRGPSLFITFVNRCLPGDGWCRESKYMAVTNKEKYTLDMYGWVYRLI